MKYLNLLAKHRKNQSSFLLIFLALLLTSCGSEENSFSTKQTGSPFKVTIDAKGVRIDLSSLQNITDITRITIDYYTGELSEDFNRRVDTNVKNDNFSTSDSFYTLPGVIITKEPVKYSYFISVYRNNNLYSTQNGVFNTLATKPPNITSGFDNITFDFTNLENTADIERISIEYTTSTADQPRKYDSSVDTQNNDVTKDTSYILPNLTPGTTYYYRFTAYRGNFEQIDISDTVTKTIRPPNITSGFDNITFDFASLDTPADIDRISIEYTASQAFANAKEYDLSVDSSKGNFSTSDNNYILRRVIDNTRYYYRFTVYRGKLEQVSTGDVATKMTHAPVITSGFDSITFDFTNLENPADIDRISIEYTTSKASADAKEYDFSVDTRHNDFTKDTPYILPNLTPDTTYHYRIVVKRGEARQVVIDNFSTSVVDSNGNGLIEISTLTQLHNIRYNLKGTSYKTDDSDASSASGCPRGVCRGYELTKSLDFDKNNSGSTWSTSDNNGTIKYTLDQGDNVEPYFVVNSGGWEPIGEEQLVAGSSTKYTCDDNGNNTCFDAIFDGNNHTISSLAIRKDLQYLGMFGATGASADIRNLGLLANLTDYTGVSNDAIYIGGLVGNQNGGNIAASYAIGEVNGGFGNNDRVGGLVGLQDVGSITASYTKGGVNGRVGGSDHVGGLVGEQIGGKITASYAIGAVDGGAGTSDQVGGLVGHQDGGSITTSYTTGGVDGGAEGDDRVGGLVGFQNNGSITASYAKGKIDGGDGNEDRVGGLVGYQFKGIITASYATGNTDGGDGSDDYVGGLVGHIIGSSTITDSYSFGNITNQEMPGEPGTTKPSGVNTINDLTLSNAGGSWNSTTKNTFRAWDFGTTNQPPALKYDDYDGASNTNFTCVGMGTATDDNTIYLPYCGNFLPGQGRFDIDISSKGAKFDFTNLRSFTDIIHISIEYTTTNDNIYEFRVDTDNNTDFTKDIPYTLENLTSSIIYYYRIVVARGEEQESFFGEFTIFRADIDSNGLIEIDSLTQLHNIRYNLKGTSYKTGSNDIGSTIGCPNAGCFGYELTQSLDFDKNKDGSTWSTSDNNGTIEYTLDASDNAVPYFVVDSGVSGGWKPIGTAQFVAGRTICDNNNNTCFDAIFDGKGNKIKGLAMRRDLQYLGMFGATGASADIRNLGLLANLADYTGASNDNIFTGGLVGSQNGGSITTSYATGNTDGGAGHYDIVGGLVGLQDVGSITASYATGVVDGGAGDFDRVGGLVGRQEEGSITASYATGNVDGRAGDYDRVGGLVGIKFGGSITASYATGGLAGGAGDFENVGGLVGNQKGGSITASYATGGVAGGAGDTDLVGGLVGFQEIGSITASYATGNTDGGAGSGDYVGGLVGFQSSGSITDSYSFGNIVNEAFLGEPGTTKPSGVNTINDLTLSNAGDYWNSTTDNTFSAWGFGTNQLPILKYADYDGTTAGRKFACLGAANTTTDATTIYLPYCGDFLPGQERSLGVDISSKGAKFGFNNLRDFTDITSIRIQYTTSDNSNYEFSVDSANDFTKDTPYTLVLSPSRIIYYYRIVVARGEEQEIFSGDFIIFLADVDNNGLIEIDSLTQLHNMRYNLKGTSYKTGRNMSGSTIGCPIDTGCFGYELTGDLDFDTNNSGSTWSTSDNTGTIEYTLDQGDSAEPYFVVNSDDSGGWIPIGKAQLPAGSTDSTCDNNGNNTCFDAIFDGKGNKIKGLAMRRDLQYLGMFGATGASADIRNLGLLANLADYTGASNENIYIGGLVGRQNGGSITASYAEGNAAGADGHYDIVGGLVGLQDVGSITASYATGKVAGGAGTFDRVGGLVGAQDGGSITASYATGNADGRAGAFDSVGGLVGIKFGGSITASYATGGVAGGDGTHDRVGGLVGEQKSEGSITASYATGGVAGGAGDSDLVGGLVGFQEIGSITASYATGKVAGGAGSGDYVGGLIGFSRGGRITDSYSFGNITNQEIPGEPGTTQPSGVNTINDLTLGNAGDSWNSTTKNTFRAWDFGTTNQPPALKYADYDGTTNGSTFACLGAENTATANNTIYLPYCGNFLPGQRRFDIDISSKGAKFDFTNLDNTADITRISIEYTTTNDNIYEFRVDTDNNTDFTKDNPYTLENLTSRIIYYYRIVVERGGEQESFFGEFTIFRADIDNNGLIEIDSLTQLHNMRYNLKGTSYKTDSSDIGSTIGCPVATGCFGYELTRDLDFDKDGDGSTWSTSDADNNGTIEYTLDASDNVEPYFVVDSGGSGGWKPIGDNTNSDANFDAIFDGKGNKIKGLAMRKDLQYLGMFGVIGANADIRNLGLVANLADYTGTSNNAIHIGGLVGRQDGGNITASYTKGTVDGGDGFRNYMGGLVGGQDDGSITASYTKGTVAGGAGNLDNVGGLVGRQDGGRITASYATGDVAGGAGNFDNVGGLAGYSSGSIIASYATGNADGGAGDYDNVGGLVGVQLGGGNIDSYGFGQIASQEVSGYSGANKPIGVNNVNDFTSNNVEDSWNNTIVNTSRAWDFGTNRQPPALKYADYDGAIDGSTFACLGAENTATANNTIYLPYCGDFLPGQGRSPVGGNSATGTSITLGNFVLVDNDFDGYIEISNLVALGNIIYNPQGTSYKTSTASKGITSGCPRGVCRGYELTRSFSTTELESGGVAHYLRNILTQDAVIKSNGYSIADIYLQE